MINVYKVLITPVKNINGYEASATDVTEYVISGGIGDISLKSDANDFDIGQYTYDYVDIKFTNFSGYFSDIEQPRTLFKFGRDKAKVEIQYRDLDGDYIASFKGIINDEFTVQDLNKNEVKLRVMSYDSIFRKLVATVGTVSPTMLVSTAFKVLLNRPAVTNLINYSASLITPLLDIAIDAVDGLENVSFKDAFNKLLEASCSVMFVDEDNYINVRSRTNNSNTPHYFWNWGDLLGRNNIIGIEKYNTGLQRAFNLFKIDLTSSQNTSSINEFALREKELSLEKIFTDVNKQQLICDTYVANFAYPKKEFELTVKTELAKDIKLFDLVSVDYKSKPLKQAAAPVLYTLPMPLIANNLPIVYEGQQISPVIGFKVIAKTIKTDKLETVLKLREIGTAAGDSALQYGYKYNYRSWGKPNPFKCKR